MHPIPTPETIKPMGLDLPPAQLPEFNHLRNYAAVTGSFLAVTGALASANSVHAEDTPVPLPTEQTVAPLPTPPTELTPITPPAPSQPSANTATFWQEPVASPPGTPLTRKSKPRVRALKFRKTSKNCGIAALRLSSQPGYEAMKNVKFSYGLNSSLPRKPWSRTEYKGFNYRIVNRAGVRIPLRICNYEKDIRLHIAMTSSNTESYMDNNVKFHPRLKKWVAITFSSPV